MFLTTVGRRLHFSFYGPYIPFSLLKIAVPENSLQETTKCLDRRSENVTWLLDHLFQHKIFDTGPQWHWRGYLRKEWMSFTKFFSTYSGGYVPSVPTVKI